jgi:hypothetical protein
VTRVRAIRLVAAAAGLALAAAAVTGCSFGPDPAEVRAEARAVFDDLVATMSEADPAILRAVETVPESEQACGEDDRGTQRALVATGTLSITAPEDGAKATVEALEEELDPESWDRIRRASAASEQRAWASEDGIVVAVTVEGPVLVTAVFTPCAT